MPILQKILQGWSTRRLPIADITASFKKKKRMKVYLWAAFGILCLAVLTNWFYNRVKKMEIKQIQMLRDIKRLQKTSPVMQLGLTAIPPRLAKIPFGEDLGIVIDVSTVNVPNVTAPYNPSFIKTVTGYDLFFRYDLLNPKLEHSFYGSYIGVISLDHQFKQLHTDFKRIELQNDYSEDPRVLWVEDQLFLFFNCLNNKNPSCRNMCVANLNPITYQVNYSTTLDMNLRKIEKNWSPFAYIDTDQKHHLFLEYKINPRKLLKLPIPTINDLKNVPVPSQMAYLDLFWEEKWGTISGGTPALLIGEEYLSFFHSWFLDEKGLTWYVMGAYTFAAEEPFHMTGISAYPILYNGIYETPLLNTASIKKRVIFPSGFVVERKSDRELIYLSLGENDAGVKIVTIDKENLIRNMIRFGDPKDGML
jgi:predicted GH43/DUF377 family glycosyl hydrolase